MPQSSINHEKCQLREQLKFHRSQLSSLQIHEYSQQLTKTLLAHPLWKNASTIVGFVGVRGEPDTTLLLQQALREQKQLLLPRVIPHPFIGIEFLEVISVQKLTPARYGLLEPAEGIVMPLTSLRKATIILVPGLGFSPSGARIGFGKGHYDQALEPIQHFPHIKRIGLCFPSFLQRTIPMEPQDISMHWLATPSQMIDCRSETNSL